MSDTGSFRNGGEFEPMLNGKKVNVRAADDFDPVPMDKYTAQIVDVDLKTKLNNFSHQEEEILNYKFQILSDKPMPVVEGKPAQSTRGKFVWREVRPVVNARSWYGKLIKAVMGRDLTNEEIGNFDPESLVGKIVDIMTEQSIGKDGQRVFVNIISFAKATEQLDPVTNTRPTSTVVEKSTAPAVAPASDDEEADKLIGDLEEEAADDAEDDDEIAKMEEELAKKKAAKKAAEAKQ